MIIQRFSFSTDSRRFAAAVLLLIGGRHQGLQQSRRHFRSGDRCAWSEQSIAADNRPNLVFAARALDRMHPRRPLLGAAMVRHHAPARLLGRVRSSAQTCRTTCGAGGARYSGGRWPTRLAQPANRRNSRMTALYRPPHFADDPDAARDPVRVLRRGAVRAGRSGGAGDRAAQRRRHRSEPRGSRARPAAISARATRSAPPADAVEFEISRRAGAGSRNSSRAWKSSSASTSRRRNASR